MYDSKCYDLAESFLEDQVESATDLQKGRLAQAIQDCIEDWIEDEFPQEGV